MKIRLFSRRAMRRSQWELQNKPHWRAEHADGYIGLPPMRGCRPLEVEVEVDGAKPGDRIFIRAGKGRHGVEEVLIVPGGEEPVSRSYDWEVSSFTRKFDDAMVPRVHLEHGEVVRVPSDGEHSVDGREYDSFARRMRDAGLRLEYEVTLGKWDYHRLVREVGDVDE